MIRIVLVVAALVVLAGCGDRRAPVVREVLEPPEESEGSVAHPGLPMESGPAAATAGEPLPEHGGVVALDSMQLTAPQTWLRKPPQIDFIVAEFLLPRAQGDPADGRLTVTTAGGTVEDNIARWRDQFGGKPEKESREKIEVGGVPITVVDFTGTYRDQRGPFAPAEERPDYRMIGAILEIGGQTYFVKGYGPAKTMAAHAEEIQAFLRSLKSGGASP